MYIIVFYFLFLNYDAPALSGFFSFPGGVGDCNITLCSSVYSVYPWSDPGRCGGWREVLPYAQMGEVIGCESKLAS